MKREKKNPQMSGYCLLGTGSYKWERQIKISGKQYSNVLKIYTKKKQK